MMHGGSDWAWDVMFTRECAHREMTVQILSEMDALRAELRRWPGRVVTLEVTSEALRLLRASRWDFKLIRRARYLADLRDFRTRVRVYAPPVEEAT